MTGSEPTIEQLRREFPGICVTPSATGRQCHYGVRICGLKEKKRGTGTCVYHRDAHLPVESKALGRCLSRAEKELALVLAHFNTDSTRREELAALLIDQGWRREGLNEEDYSRFSAP